MKHITAITIQTIISFLIISPALGNVTSATVTAAPRSSIGGSDYYVANQNYTFRVQATSTNTLRSEWNSIQLQIRDAGNTAQHSITISVDTWAVTASTGLNYVGIVDNSNYAAGNLDYDLTVKIPWSAPNEIAIADSDIFVTVSDDAPSSSTDIDDPAANFGTTSSIKVMNLAQTGNAADGKVNRLHDTFNVTGTLVYNVVSATVFDIIPAGDISSAELYRDIAATGITDTDSNLVLTVPDDYFNAVGLGTYNWSVRVVLSAGAGGGTETNIQTLAIRCDRVLITDIIVSGGGGRDATPNFWRSVNVPGTNIRVYAIMENGGGNVEGNTVVRVRYDYGGGAQTTDVTILSGAAWGETVVTYPTLGEVAVDNTLDTGAIPINYIAEEIIGGPYDETNAGNGQHVNGNITQDATQIRVWWDNFDPPGASAVPFTAEGIHATTATSFTLNWTGLVAGAADGDFYSYRIYYKKSSASVWNMIDRNIANYGPAQTYDLSDITRSTADVESLAPLTSYDFRLSAIDLFGNEVILANQIQSPPLQVTKPSGVSITISDGITQYGDTTFDTDPNPTTTHTVRKTSIRVTISIVTAGNTPEAVNLIVADNNSDVAGDYGSGIANDIINDLTPAQRYSFAAVKSSPNTWIAFIPENNPLMTIGSTIRFVIETKFNGQSTYVDHDSEGEYPVGDFTDEEWRFTVSKSMNFTPWPVRILNNVITDKNPKAYPSYYLTDDASVTIKVYDIKGRAVVTLLENASRKSGQNIKEQGWSGINRANKKLGVGLYYIHIKAKRSSDGKVILNKFKKIVIAR